MLIDISKEPGYNTLINTDHVIKVTFHRTGKGDGNIVTSFHMTDGSIEEFKGLHPTEITRHSRSIIPAPLGYKLISICDSIDIPNDEDIFFYEDVVALAIDNRYHSIKFIGAGDWPNDTDCDQIILTPDQRVILPGDKVYNNLEEFKKERIEEMRKKSAA